MTEPGDGLFERLAAYREDVFRVCLGFSRNSADAEDLCQDVFIKAFARGDALRNPGGSRIWLLRIARTTCLDRIRRERRRPTISLDSQPRHEVAQALPDPPARARPRPRPGQGRGRPPAPPAERGLCPAGVWRAILRGDRPDLEDQAGHGDVAAKPGPPGRGPSRRGGKP